MSRQRTTWAAAGRRRASAPPANPGYGVENIHHPAYYDDPAYEAYKKGDPSAWGEDPHQPPYPQGNPPAIPGYDVEDGHHPAHKSPPRVPQVQPKQATLVAQVEEKAGLAYRVAQAMLRGKQASAAQVEDQALDLMDLPTDTLQASLDRLGGGFLASPEEEEFDMMGMDDLDDGPFMGMDDDGDMYGMSHFADQNSHPGPTQGPGAQSEDEERADQEEVSQKETKQAAEKLASQVFASYDHDGDGFVTINEWTGNKALFAAIDTDGDHVISREDFIAVTAGDDDSGEDEEDEGEEAKKASGHDLYADLDAEEAAMLRAMQDEVACGQVMASDESEGDPDDEEEEEESEEAKKKAARIARLKAELARLASEDGDDPEEEEEEESEEAKKKASDFHSFVAGEEEEEDEDPAGKEAAAYFAQAADPMGLADGAVRMSSSEKATLESLFEMDTPASTTASLDDVLNPQPRQASNGVQQLGQMTRSASAGAGSGLENLWNPAPNVDEHFGM